MERTTDAARAHETTGERHRPRVVLIGPMPPPYMGPSLATEILLGSTLKKAFDLVHLDTSHHKTLKTLGRMNFQNILSALKHSLTLVITILSKRPEIVYVPISQTTIGYFKDSIYILIGKLLGRRIVCHLRGGHFRTWFDVANFAVRAYVRFVHSFVDVQIVLGECLKPLFEGLVSEEAIFVVPNGRDFDFDRSQVHADTGGKPRILFLGNILESKGALDLVRAVPILRSAGIEAEFVLAGSYENLRNRPELDAHIEREGDEVVRLIGPVVGDEKFNLLKSADIFVFPTYFPFEGHPWVIVEAMAAGLPIVTTDHAAIRESVVDGVNGLIVAKQNPQDIADRIRELVASPSMRRRMGEASRHLYEQKFTEAKMVEAMSVALHAAHRSSGRC